MKLLVCISKTPDTTTKIAFTDNNTKFNADKVQFIINPYDEWYALVRALELKEKIWRSRSPSCTWEKPMAMPSFARHWP